MAAKAQSKAETLGFQTEAKQLLHLMIHSLYSNKEIYLGNFTQVEWLYCCCLRIDQCLYWHVKTR